VQGGGKAQVDTCDLIRLSFGCAKLAAARSEEEENKTE
jgi:hypothetical protein